MESPWINGLVLLGKLKPESPMIFMIFMGISSHGFRLRVSQQNQSGWWVQTFVIFRNIWDNPFPLTNIFQVKTTNQQSIEWRNQQKSRPTEFPRLDSQGVSVSIPGTPGTPQGGSEPGGKLRIKVMFETNLVFATEFESI